jgi:hypothetical protein
MTRQLSAFEGRHEAEEVQASGERSFGRVFAGFFAIVALWPLIHAQAPRWWALAIATAFLLASIFVPQWLAPLN